LFGINRGLYTAPGRDEEWTLSVAHSEADVRHYLAVFEELCADLAR
jgi:glutamate-1-semialdehyde 2,1-aminomutase